jgi:NAD(P)H dehydrogenase (quinone)
MGGPGTAAARPVPPRAAAGTCPPGDRERDLVREPDRLRLAVPAQRLPSVADRLRLLQALPRRRHLAAAARPLPDQARAAAGRDPRPTAAAIDSQSVKAADTVPRASRGWDNAKKVNGRKRHIAVDALGLVLAVVVTAASVQDRDGARPLLWNLARCCTRIRLAWASVEDLAWADAFAFGTPTRFGAPAAQLKQFIDQAGRLWQEGRLADKPVAAFTSAFNGHGGSEATICSLRNVSYHWGALIVPPGYADPVVYAAGGKPYGTSVTGPPTGHGPDATALEAARYQGRRLAQITIRLLAGSRVTSANRNARGTIAGTISQTA